MVSATPWCARSHPHTGTSSTRLVLREPSPQTGPPKHRAELPKTLSSVKSAAYKTGCEISGLSICDDSIFCATPVCVKHPLITLAAGRSVAIRRGVQVGYLAQSGVNGRVPATRCQE